MTEFRNKDGLPPGLDPEEFPVIATHVFGWRHVGEVTARIVDRLGSERAVGDDDHEAAA